MLMDRRNSMAWLCMLLKGHVLWFILHVVKVTPSTFQCHRVEDWWLFNIGLYGKYFACCLICILRFLIGFIHFFLISCSSSSGGERRHKRRRHEKSLDRETSLWWHVLAVPLCCQSVNQKKGKSKKNKQKKDTVPHSTTFVLCYTVFLSFKSVCKLCETKKIVRNSINARNRDTSVVFFFYVYQCLVIPATEGSHNYTTLTSHCCFNGPSKTILNDF